MITVKEAQLIGSTLRDEEREFAAKVEDEIDRQIREQMQPYTHAIDILIPSSTPTRAQILLKQKYTENGWYISSQTSGGNSIRWTFCTTAPSYGDRD